MDNMISSNQIPNNINQVEVPGGLVWHGDSITEDLVKVLIRRALETKDSNWLGFLFSKLEIQQDTPDYKNELNWYRYHSLLSAPFIWDFLSMVKQSGMIRGFKTWESFENAVVAAFDDKFQKKSYSV